MASTFNGSVANLVDPLANSSLNSPSHSNQHVEINDALRTVGTYTAFTPTWSGITVGNATQEWYYCQFNKMVHVFGNLIFGSTTAVTTVPIMTLPIAREALPAGIVNLGVGTLADSGTATYMAFCLSTSTTNCILFSSAAGGSYVTEGGVGATTPFTWTTNDSISMNLTYKAA